MNRGIFCCFLFCAVSVLAVAAPLPEGCDFRLLLGDAKVPRQRKVEMLPVFPMLYHGCIALYGSYSVIDGITPWDEMWGRRPAIDESRWAGKFPDQFALEFARGVTWGIQPTVHKLLPEHQTDPNILDDTGVIPGVRTIDGRALNLVTFRPS